MAFLGFKKIGVVGICVSLVILLVYHAEAAKLPKHKATEILWENSSHFHADFDKAVTGDCSSLMMRLEQALQGTNADDKYAAHTVYGEMYDRGICVLFDPAKAFKYFQKAADMGGPYYLAIVGWKYALGHGVGLSQQKANEAFKLLLIRTAFIQKKPNIDNYLEYLRGREMPEALEKGVGWLLDLSQEQEGMVNLALGLLDGSGKYFDGTPLPVDVMAAREILNRQAHNGNHRARFILGREQLKGSFGQVNIREGTYNLMESAKCGYVPSMIRLAELAALNNNADDVFGWYLMAQRNGASVEIELEKARKNAGSLAELTVPDDKRFMTSCQ